jgi:hypothetical protein
MKKFKILFLLILIVSFKVSPSKENVGNTKPTLPLPPSIISPENPDYAVPEIPTSGIDVDEEDLRYLETTYTVMMEAKVNVFIPLEVISDINIETTVIGNQIKEIPFEIELNRKPEKENYYSIKYSESMIDIDQDGKMDTYIHSPAFINEKITKDNYVKIYGENISKEGKHNKVVYVTVEIGNSILRENKVK